MSVAKALLLACLVATASAGWGLTTSTDFYVVDTGTDLTFSIRRHDPGRNGISPGDIASLKWKGVEYTAPNGRGSHINSGFDWLWKDSRSSSVSAQYIGNNNNYIKITVTTKYLTHYYIAQRKSSRIYMATYFTKEPEQESYCRFIFRLNPDLLPNCPKESDQRNVVAKIESADIFKEANGQTRSKHYSNQRLKDWKYIGASGKGVGMWVVRGNHEGDSGGPFYRSLLMQTGSVQDITYIMNYGMSQTEAYRTNILNQYVFVVTDGGAPPTDIDTSYLYSFMQLKGYVPPAGRGTVKGKVQGRDLKYEYTVALSNDRAQYWADVDVKTKQFWTGKMLPGSYKMTVYKNELSVYTATVAVTAGRTQDVGMITITKDLSFDKAIWRIGDWDGSPMEMRNGDMVTKMHPSDVRMTTWNPMSFVIGTNTEKNMPAYMWQGVNNGYAIHFKLSKAESAGPRTVRIGITTAYAGGRPSIRVNGWTSKAPSASSQPKTRSMTVGTYRGNNKYWTYAVPASAWAAAGASNKLTINVVSGSSGDKWLSPGFSLDCIDLLAGQEAAATPKPKPTAAPLAPPLFQTGTYTLTSKLSNKVVEISGKSTNDGGNVAQWAANGGTNQQWTITDAPNGYYRIQNVNSGKVMSVQGKSKAEGKTIEQWGWRDSAHQMWALKESNGYYGFKNRNSGMMLDLWQGNRADGADYVQAQWTGADNQLFKLTAVKATPVPQAPPPTPPRPAPTPTTPPPPTAQCENPGSSGHNCHVNLCCATGLACYEANPWYAECRSSCAADRIAAGWTCKKREPATCKNPVGAWGNCHNNHCCAKGWACYEANQWYAQCRPSCEPDKIRQGWSCKKLS